MSTKHTPRLRVVPDTTRCDEMVLVEGAEGHIVAQTFSPRLGDAEEFAARIVACVNACEGINPEAVPEMLETLARIAGSLQMLRRKFDNPETTGIDFIINDALATIAKAEGRAP